MIELRSRAESVRLLSGLLRAGLPLNEAVRRWSHEAPPEARPSLERMARRIALGQSPERAAVSLEDWEEDAEALATVCALYSEVGGDVAEMLDALAAGIEERRAWRDQARSAGAGARVSSRVVAGLPLAFVPLTAAAGTPLFDPTGVTFVVAGICLVVVGMKWMRRLLPDPPGASDLSCSLAALVVASVKGGAPVELALNSATRRTRHDDLIRARRLVDLGFSWAGALARAGDPGLRALATVLEATQGFGLPVIDALQRFIGRRREQLAREFEAATKRASVLMMIPLTVCILPAFAILALGPFLRGLSLG